MLKQKISRIVKRTLIGTAVIVAASSAGGSAAAAGTDTSMNSFSLNDLIRTYYTDSQEITSDQTEDLNIGLNTIEGRKGFDEKSSTLSMPVEEMFSIDDTSYINETSGDLVLRVSNPDVVRLDENEEALTKTLQPEGPLSAHDITLHAASKGAAMVYLNVKHNGNTTTLGTVEVEVR
ncbi:hypothetical protein [Salibacterium halotolerans]|uniref:Uncharacterized protein n=1 Tax=Salibacterium halotolerans TaxID=1884432 RepID=A0A1I5RRQ7_9BACI|nr:hypothetical protein [Salibacterium halotolerans]SFP61198.1 hypothetical protein SAMN05518683_107146 [Salibacterium halotolerans]